MLNQKIEDHKSFFQDIESVQKQFINAMHHSPLVHQIPREQIESIDARLQGIGPKVILASDWSILTWILVSDWSIFSPG